MYYKPTNFMGIFFHYTHANMGETDRVSSGKRGP